MAVTLTAAKPRLAEQPDVQHRVVRPQLPGDEAGQRHGPDDEGADAPRGWSSRVRCPGPGRGPRRTVPTLTRPTPTRSSRDRRPRDSDSFHQASGTSTRPTGTFSQKMYCHDHPVVTAPPTSGPMATAAPPMAPHIPRATLRRSGGTAALSSVSDNGMIMAPPAPWRARAATSTPMLGARAASGRGRGEHGDARDEDPPAAEPLADGRGRQQQHGEGQGVGVDRPLQPGQPGVEVDPDDRQGGRDHQVVQGGHEQGQAGDGHRPDGPELTVPEVWDRGAGAPCRPSRWGPSRSGRCRRAPRRLDSTASGTPLAGATSAPGRHRCRDDGRCQQRASARREGADGAPALCL